MWGIASDRLQSIAVSCNKSTAALECCESSFICGGMQFQHRWRKRTEILGAETWGVLFVLDLLSVDRFCFVDKWYLQQHIAKMLIVLVQVIQN